MGAQGRPTVGRVVQPIKLPIKLDRQICGCRSLASGSFRDLIGLLVSLVIQREYSRSRLDRQFDRLHTFVLKMPICRSNDQIHGSLIGRTAAGA